MTHDELITHWKEFFKDLFIGTFTRAVICGSLGFGLGATFLVMFKGIFLDPAQLTFWLTWPILCLSIFWFLLLGTLHGISGAAIYTIHKKISETVGGLQSLLDLLSHQVLGSISKIHRVSTKDEIAKKFNSFGQQFLENLNLKGPIGWGAGFLFRLVIKILRLLFLDEITEMILNKPSEEITSADIESAIRRIGVKAIVSPIIDRFILIHFLNFALMGISLGIPFFIFWLI